MDVGSTEIDYHFNLTLSMKLDRVLSIQGVLTAMNGMDYSASKIMAEERHINEAKGYGY